MTEVSPAMKAACAFYRDFNKDGLVLPRFSQGEQHALQVLAAYIESREPSDEQIKRAMLIQMRQQAEKMEPGFWRDRALAQCDGIAEMDMDDPEMQEGLAMGRVFLGLVYQPLTTEAPNGDEE